MELQRKIYEGQLKRKNGKIHCFGEKLDNIGGSYLE